MIRCSVTHSNLTAGTGRYNRPQARAMLTALILGALLLLQSAVPAAPAEIALDFIATGQDGQAVTNLAMADINLKVGGKQRPVRSLELVIPAETGRTILLLADEATLYAMEPVAKEAIAKLVASLKPKDRIRVLQRAKRTPQPAQYGARAGDKGGRCDGDRSGRPADMSVGYAANHREPGAKPPARTLEHPGGAVSRQRLRPDVRHWRGSGMHAAVGGDAAGCRDDLRRADQRTPGDRG